MNTPKNLKYAETHEWIEQISEDTVRIGLTDYAQQQLGDIVFINLPAEEDAVTIGESFGEAESVKAVSDIVSPVSGVVKAVNDELLDNPAAANDDPYASWLLEVIVSATVENLMDADEYQAFCEKEG